VKPSAIPVTFARKSSPPCRPPRSIPLRQLWRAAAACYPAPSWFALQRTSRACGRRFEPTSANRLTTRVPVDRSIPGLELALHDRRMLPRPRSSSSERRRTTLRQSDPGWFHA
jgi:hypothetical protein